MASLEAVQSAFQSLSLGSVIISNDASLSTLKCLLLKPKTLATATPEQSRSVLLVTLTTAAPLDLKALARVRQVKEYRVGADDLSTELLGVSRSQISPLLIQSSHADKLTVIVDTAVLAVDNVLTVLGEQTVKISSKSIPLFVSSHHVAVDQLDLSTVAASVSSTKNGETTLTKPVAPASNTAAVEVDPRSKLGVEVKKDEDFPTWYSQVLTRADMLEYYDVSGCYILRPASFKVWKTIQLFFTAEIEKLGVEEAYFPMFVSNAALQKEKDHVEGFMPEVAWVTKSGSTDLPEPIAVRPTSETIMYPAYAKWIQSHRDLPLRLNQWTNVVRWEFKHPQPFLRTREFLWQEGHSAFATRPEADAEVLNILTLYQRIYEEILAVPVVKGTKSKKEKFAGGHYTTTVEGFIPTTGRGIQGATSHCLGQNFAKMFKIQIEDEQNPGQHRFVWQNSWGITTRTIGVMVMVHGDDRGLVLPPRVASIQVVIVPVGVTARTTEEERQSLMDHVQKVSDVLRCAQVRVHVDARHQYTPGWKFNYWELRGIPLRLELGPRDLTQGQATLVRRDTGDRLALPLNQLHESVPTLLQTVQSEMLSRARAVRDAHIIQIESWSEFVPALDGKNLVLAPWCERPECEDDIKERSGRQPDSVTVDEKAPSMGAKSLCIPFEQPANAAYDGEPCTQERHADTKPTLKCVACGGDAWRFGLFGRSY